METYEDSVLAAADSKGNLTERQVRRLLKDHCIPILDNYPGWDDKDFNAQRILNWLGY